MNNPRYIIRYFRGQYLIVDTQKPISIVEGLASSSKAAEVADEMNDRHESAVVSGN